MTIEITERTRALWYLELPNGNWSGVLEELDDGGGCKLECRFRWYKGSEIWDSKDEKNWYTVTGGSGTAKMIDNTRSMIAAMKVRGAGRSWELLRGAESLEDFFQKFVALPFVHARKAEPGEIEERPRR